MFYIYILGSIISEAMKFDFQFSNFGVKFLKNIFLMKTSRFTFPRLTKNT